MKFLLDENFPKTAANFLGDQGHECFDVRGTELEGHDDAALVEEAQRREAIILTTIEISTTRSDINTPTMPGW